jgi:hypothetical protein
MVSAHHQVLLSSKFRRNNDDYRLDMLPHHVADTGYNLYLRIDAYFFTVFGICYVIFMFVIPYKMMFDAYAKQHERQLLFEKYRVCSPEEDPIKRR